MAAGTGGLAEAARGAAYLPRAFAWWRTHPGLLALGLVPALVVALALLAAFVALVWRLGDVVGALTGFADGWADPLRAGLEVGLGLVLLGGFAVVAVLAFTALTLLVGDPFYERIWRGVEETLGPPLPTGEVPFWRSALDAVRLLGVGLALGVLVLLLGFLPVVGAVAGAVAGTVVAGRLLATELLGRPLEARGLDAAARGRLLAAARWRVLGYGVAVQACFWVPLGAVVVMPVAVVGATLLARDLLDPAAPQT